MGWLTGLLDWVLGWFSSSESKLVKAVRDSTVLLCGFLPTVETVVALVAVQNPAVMTAMGIARKICAAVTSAPKTGRIGLMSAPVIVDGIVIEGEFVGKE
jgi:phosphohistidine phosphatase SixA